LIYYIRGAKARQRIVKEMLNKKYASGSHFLGKIYTSNSQKLLFSKKAPKVISKAIEESGFKELGSFYHEFPQGGFTGVVVLSESHVAIHTWPEFNYLTMDVYVCNYTKDNTAGCEKLFDQISKFFEPKRVIKKKLLR